LDIAQKKLCVYIFIGRKDERQPHVFLCIHPETFQHQIGRAQNLEFSKSLPLQAGHSLDNGICRRVLCFPAENLSQRIPVLLCIKFPNKASQLRTFRLLRLAQVINIGNAIVVFTQYGNALCAALQTRSQTLPQCFIRIGAPRSGRMEKERDLPSDRLPVVRSHCAKKVTKAVLVVPQFAQEAFSLINERVCRYHVLASCHSSLLYCKVMQNEKTAHFSKCMDLPPDIMYNFDR
jgi:hypothetical protein